MVENYSFFAGFDDQLGILAKFGMESRSDKQFGFSFAWKLQKHGEFTTAENRLLSKFVTVV